MKAVTAGKLPHLTQRGRESGFLASLDLLFPPLNQCGCSLYGISLAAIIGISAQKEPDLGKSERPFSWWLRQHTWVPSAPAGLCASHHSSRRGDSSRSHLFHTNYLQSTLSIVIYYFLYFPLGRCRYCPILQKRKLRLRQVI